MPPFIKRAIPMALLALGVAIPLYGRSGMAQVPPSGTFTANQDCEATRAINGANPDNIRLTVGDRYQSIGFNSPQRRYILLKVPGSTPDRRWVSADCGTFQPSGDDNSSPIVNPGNGQATGLLPFFDNEDNPVPVDLPRGAQKDITPKPPNLEPFDNKVLELCGAGFNAPVSADRFSRLMTYYPDVVRKLKQATGGELKPNRRSDPEFIQDLTFIWFNQQGFKHIFCGEKDGNSIGGLHFVGRYWQLQQAHLAGRWVGQNTKQEVIDDAIYTFGALVMQDDRVIARSPVKGYPYNLNAQETLIDATKAFKLFQISNRATKACLYTVSEPPIAPYQAIFVKKLGAIRTFYPDATPEDSKTDGPCER